MKTEIAIGSTVFGAANIGRKVLRVDDDELIIEMTGGVACIPISRVVRVEPPSLPDRLDYLSSLDKIEAIAGLNDLFTENSTNDIYEASLDINPFQGTFIRRLLSDIKPIEFAAIGSDGSEGKYGVLTFPDLPPISQ
jgi:hypothetical protein